jgi:hypothetical protein
VVLASFGGQLLSDVTPARSGYFITFLPLPATVGDSLIVGIVVLLIGGTVLLLLMWEKRMSRLVSKLEKLPVIGEKLHTFTDMFANVQKEGQKVRRSLIVVAFLIFLSLVVNAGALYLIFSGLWHSSLSLLLSL